MLRTLSCARSRANYCFYCVAPWYATREATDRTAAAAAGSAAAIPPSITLLAFGLPVGFACSFAFLFLVGPIQVLTPSRITVRVLC